jgi:putative phosphoesterase
MKIGVISDTHGNIAAIRRAVIAVGAVERWLHAGDYSQDGAFLAELTGLEVTTVAGNCDGTTDAKVDEFLEVGGKRIWLTHGHRYRAKDRTNELVWWGRQSGADIVVYGHSHVPDISWHDGLLVFNPGSTYHPRGGYAASCGLLTITDGKAEAAIIEI